MSPAFESDQGQDYSISRAALPYGSLRYLFARSNESRVSSSKGQDYLSWRCDTAALNFVICDGVGSSFCGHVAAEYLGRKLLTFMADVGPRLEQLKDRGQISELTSKYLYEWRDEGDRLVQSETLPAHLPLLQIEALRQLRDDHGSETVFVCGRLSSHDPNSAWPDRLTLIWMGDTEVRVYDRAGRMLNLGGGWRNADRWSTKYGVSKRGVMTHAWAGDIEREQIGRIIVFSDGLAFLAAELPRLDDTPLQEAVLTRLMSPASDDISLLDIRLEPDDADHRLTAPAWLREDRDRLTWQPVSGASGYDLEESGSAVFSDPRHEAPVVAAWSLMESRLGAAHRYYRVRTRVRDQHGPWSHVLSLLPPRPEPPRPRLRGLGAAGTGTCIVCWEPVDGARYYVLYERQGADPVHMIYTGYDVEHTLAEQPPGIYHYTVQAWGVSGPSLVDATRDCIREVPPRLDFIGYGRSGLRILGWSPGAQGQEYVLERARQDTFDSAVTVYSGLDSSCECSPPAWGETWFYRVRLRDGLVWSNIVGDAGTVEPLSHESPDARDIYALTRNAAEPTAALQPSMPIRLMPAASTDGQPPTMQPQAGALPQAPQAAVSPLAQPHLEVHTPRRFDQPVALSWSRVADADSYDLQVAASDILRDSDRFEMVYQGRECRCEVQPAEPKSYFYRVRGVSGDRAGPWSEIAKVVIKAGPLAPPQMFAIANPYMLREYDIVWESVQYAEWYELEERRPGLAFHNVWRSMETSERQPSTRIMLTQATVSNQRAGVYAYRVRACNASGKSGYSNEVSTEVRAAPLGRVQVEEIDNPQGRAWWTLRWQRVEGAVEYVVEVSQSAGFAPSEVYSCKGENWLDKRDKAPGEYFYRVFACERTGVYDRNLPSNVVRAVANLEVPSWRVWDYEYKDQTIWLEMKWKGVKGAAKYEIRQAGVAGKIIPPPSDTQCKYRVDAPGQYAFQVRAVTRHDVPSEWSQTRTVLVERDPKGYLKVKDFTVT